MTAVEDNPVNKDKILYLLIGPKGSGKTHIGTQIDRHTNIHFLRVEPLWLALKAGEDGWQKVAETVDKCFDQYDRVMIESLGAGEGFGQMLARLKQRCRVRLIKVETALNECMRRVRARDNRDHIPVSDDRVAAYNQAAAQIVYDWDAVIDNNGPADLETLLRGIEQAG